MGIKHYLKFFLSENILKLSETTQKYIKDYKITGVAFSGDIDDELESPLYQLLLSKMTK